MLIHKHAVMPADDVFCRVTHGLQEVVIGRQNMALQIEFDHGLHFVERVQLALHVGILLATALRAPEKTGHDKLPLRIEKVC